MYNEQHTKRVLEDERKNETAVIGQNRSANLVTDRQIKQMRTFTSKKDEAHAKMKEEYEELNEELAKLNEDIAKKAVKLDQDTRAYKDRNFMKRYNDELMTARQEHSMIGIDVNVSDSRIKDLDNQKKMLEKNILEVLKDKRALDKENLELEYKKSGKGETEVDSRKKQSELEIEQAMKLKLSNEVMKEQSEILNSLLSDEEKKAKDLLDQKITVDQQMESATEEFEKKSTERKNLRQELLEKRLRLSMLQSANRQMTEEDKELTQFNTEMKAVNDKLEKENDALEKEVSLIIRRIDVSTLLKQIDLEEMKVLANNNNAISQGFQQLLTDWNHILIDKDVK